MTDLDVGQLLIGQKFCAVLSNIWQIDFPFWCRKWYRSYKTNLWSVGRRGDRVSMSVCVCMIVCVRVGVRVGVRVCVCVCVCARVCINDT